MSPEPRARATRDPAPPRRAFPRGILVAVLVVVVVVAAASAIVGRIDVAMFKPRIEAAFYRDTGRTLTLAGPIHLSLLPSPGFVADDVSVANLPGGSRPVMAHVASIRASVDLGALLARRVHVRSVMLTDPDILLERVADGRPNWVFARVPAPTGGAPGPAGQRRFALDVSALDVAGGRVAWNDPRTIGSGVVDIDAMHAQQNTAHGSFTLVLDGSHPKPGADPVPFRLSIASAPPGDAARANPADPFPVRASLAFPGAVANSLDDGIETDGAFSDPDRLRGFAGRLHVRLHALQDIEGLLPHAEVPPASDLEATARLAQRPDGGWQVLALHASGGAATPGARVPGLVVTRFEVAAADPGTPVDLSFAGTLRGQALTIRAPKAATLAFLTGDPASGAAAPFAATIDLGASSLALDGNVTRASGTRGAVAGVPGSRTRIFAAAAPRLGAIPSGTYAGHAAFSTPDLAALVRTLGGSSDRHLALAASGRLDASRTGEGGLDATMDADSLSIGGDAFPASRLAIHRDPAGPGTPHGLQASAALASAPGAPWLTFREDGATDAVAIGLAGRGLPAAPILGLAGISGVAGRLDLAGNLTGRAAGTRIDPDSLHGDVAATLVDATIDGARLHAALMPVLDAIHAPGLRLEGREHLRCAGASGTLADGTLHLASVSLDSAMLDVNGSGTVRLADQALALRLTPVLSIGPAGATAPVEIGGTLSAPKAALAPGSDGRFGFSIGRIGAGAPPACDASAGLPAAAPAKMPKPADLLRAFGFLR